MSISLKLVNSIHIFHDELGKLKNERISFMCSVVNNYNNEEERHDNKWRVQAKFVMEGGGIRVLISTFGLQTREFRQFHEPTKKQK